MADSLTAGKYALAFEVGTKSDDSDRLNQVTDAIQLGGSKFPAISAELTNGTGANKASKFWGKKLTVTAGGSTTLVIGSGTALTNGRGQTVVFAKVRRLLIRVRTPAAGKKVVVGNAGTNPWAPWLSAATATEDVADVLLRVSDTDGWTVTAGAAEQLKIANPGGADVDVDVVLVGE